MSTLTIRVDQFLINTLQPEIDKLNLSLISMEEYGFDNKAIRDTKNKLNKLITHYDFLKEYAYGNEEAAEDDIFNILKLVGEVKASRKSGETNIQSVRSSIGISDRASSHNVSRIYLNDEILLSNTITSSSTPAVMKIYSSPHATSISVVYSTAGIDPITYTGVNSVVIPYIYLDTADIFTIDITTYNNGTVLNTEALSYDIIYADCDTGSISWYYGGTTNRFKILADLTESSNISIDPNSGTNAAGDTLDYTWILANTTDITTVVLRETLTTTMTMAVSDVHGIILFPVSTMSISDIHEVIIDVDATTPGDLTLSVMEEGTHYEIFPLNSGSVSFDCVYIRDLSSTTVIDATRTFQFTLTKI